MSGDEKPVARRFLRIRAVCDATGLKQSTLYAYVAAGRFPKPVKLGPRCSAWDESEVLAWRAEKLAARDQ